MATRHSGAAFDVTPDAPCHKMRLNFLSLEVFEMRHVETLEIRFI
jgi:hypothetical protein